MLSERAPNVSWMFVRCLSDVFRMLVEFLPDVYRIRLECLSDVSHMHPRAPFGAAATRKTTTMSLDKKRTASKHLARQGFRIETMLGGWANIGSKAAGRIPAGRFPKDS